MNTNEERLSAALKLLAASETRVPSADLEAKLLREIYPSRKRWLWPSGIAVAAAAGWLIAIFRPVPSPAIFPAAPPAPVASVQPESVDVPLARVARAVPRRAKRPAPAIQQYPLMRIPYAEPLDMADRAELLRVSMPAAQLLAWGFPFSGSDPNIRVNAEILVGEDGLARAVRLVR